MIFSPFLVTVTGAISTTSPLVELEDDELPLPFECPFVFATPLPFAWCPFVPLVVGAVPLPLVCCPPKGMLLFMWFFDGVNCTCFSPNRRSCESDFWPLAAVPGREEREKMPPGEGVLISKIAIRYSKKLGPLQFCLDWRSVRLCQYNTQCVVF